ncbi:carbohydrate ABC transporter permease [Agrobacterium salinitolerans]|uniref:carbohydrate ABC transporter permease n=1 Tax=Agrobacterium salinitolerans TaxID=1183413 RepID=UPI0022B8C8D5|nr:sugar ABC transporter permease [Agrobacterium salinitolerans]MCZ7853558.1 sugar ABC transporter permease [Agrobacterium salinitolerans]
MALFSSKGKLTRDGFIGWFMAGPAMVLIGLFLITPFLLGLGFSFTNQRLTSPNPTEFVGVENYTRLLGIGVLTLEPEREADGSLKQGADGAISYPRIRNFTRNNPDYPYLEGMREYKSFTWGENQIVILARDVVFLTALVNTLSFVAVVAPVQAALALFLALLVNQKIPGVTIFRAIYFMPVVLSVVVVALLWRFIYAADNGLLNSLLSYMSFGLFQPVDWLGRTDTALWAILVMSVWQGVGFHMVIWLSGLQTISPDLYEAADIEGASRWQKFSMITWPLLRNTAVLIIIVITMQAFALFAQIDVMTKGGPRDSTQSIVYQAVERGYRQQDIAAGSAISVVLFLLVLCISLTQRYLTREKQ